MKSKRAQELSFGAKLIALFFCSCYSVAIPSDVSFWLTLGHCTNPFDCATKLIIDLLPIVCLVGTSFKVFFLKSFSLFSSTIFSCRNTRLFGIASIFIFWKFQLLYLCFCFCCCCCCCCCSFSHAERRKLIKHEKRRLKRRALAQQQELEGVSWTKASQPKVGKVFYFSVWLRRKCAVS